MKQPEAWSAYARRIVATGERPHFAPEPEILDVQAAQIAAARARQSRPLEVLVLGATPELADLALMQGCRVRRVDANPAMFDAARRRETVADRANEAVIVDDWLQMEAIADASVDLVLGDSSLNNVPHAQMPAMIGQLSRVTRSGGTLSLRQIVLPDTDVPEYAFARNVANHRAGRISANEFHKVLRFFSFVHLAYDPGDCVLDARRVFDAVRTRHAAGEITDAEYAFLNTRYSEIRHTVYRIAQQRAVLGALGDVALVRAGPACYYENLLCVFVVRRG